MLQVDAFTDTPLRGNSCAILPQAEGLDTETMQAIAREMNLSETSFVLPSQVADFRCRYFTPAEEIPLAGHPTIATVHALAELGLIDADQERVNLELPAGLISVERRRQESGRTLYVMTQLKPEFGRRINRSELATALRVPENSVRADLPVQIVSTGTAQLMVPLTSLTALRNASPNAGRVLELRERAKFFSLHAFTEETLEEASTAHSRHWAPSVSGLFEDPVTGSASGGMAAYLLQHGLVEPGSLRFEQGDFMQRPGRVLAEVEFASEGVVGPPRIGGEAVLVMEGRIRL